MNFMTNNHKLAVIWDLDGTLIDSSDLHWEAWQKVTEAENIALTYEQYVADFGKRNDEILRGASGADLPDEFIARVSLAKEEVYRSLIRTKGLELARRAPLAGAIEGRRMACRWPLGACKAILTRPSPRLE